MKSRLFFTTCAVAAIIAPIPTVEAATTNFTDIQSYSLETQQHIANLVEKQIINGVTPTTFAPKEEITRGQVVKMLGRFLVNSGIATVPNDWETTQYFIDISPQAKDRELLKYAAVVKSTGVFNGKLDGSLDSAGTISRENMALVLDRATQAMRGKSLVDIAIFSEDNVVDLFDAKEEAQEAIRALNALGISNVTEFNPKGNVQRVHFATFLSKAMQYMAPDYTESTITLNASELGFSSFSEVTNLDETSLNINFSTTEITISGDFAPDDFDTFFEWVDLKGKDLFGNEHFVSIDLQLNEKLQLEVAIEKNTISENLPAQALLMDSFTKATLKSISGSREPVTQDFVNRSVYSVSKNTNTNEIMELTLTGVVQNTGSKTVTDTIQYYIDFAGNIVLNQSAQNFTLDYRYYNTVSGDIFFNDEVIKDRTFYYLPVPSYTYWDFATFQNDATIDEILAFYQTDGTKKNFDFTKSKYVLIIDENKNVYGTLDLSEYDGFFEKYTFELQPPMDLTNSEIYGFGDVILEKQSNGKILATAVGFDVVNSLIVIVDEDGSEYYYEIQQTSNGYKLVEVDEEFYY